MKHCNACGHQHVGKHMAFICIGCPCPETPGRDDNGAVNLSDDMAAALRRCSTLPHIDAGAFDPVRDEEIYIPLTRDGLLKRTVLPIDGKPFHETVLYETTEAGKWALSIHDRDRKARKVRAENV
jgi:hypothetical protein